VFFVFLHCSLLQLTVKIEEDEDSEQTVKYVARKLIPIEPVRVRPNSAVAYNPCGLDG